MVLPRPVRGTQWGLNHFQQSTANQAPLRVFQPPPNRVQHGSIWPQLSTPVVSVACQVGTVQANTTRVLFTLVTHWVRAVCWSHSVTSGKPGQMFTLQPRQLTALTFPLRSLLGSLPSQLPVA